LPLRKESENEETRVTGEAAAATQVLAHQLNILLITAVCLKMEREADSQMKKY
jgi:hypothetical protein